MNENIAKALEMIAQRATAKLESGDTSEFQAYASCYWMMYYAANNDTQALSMYDCFDEYKPFPFSED